MFKNTFQGGLLTIFYSCGSRPLRSWEKQVKNGYIKRVTDEQINSLALEMMANNVMSTFISCPADTTESLGVRLPYLVLIVKNLKKYFAFEIQILDDRKMKRRFRVSNYQSSTRIHSFDTTIPINLSDGWNQVYFNLVDFTRRAYGTTYVECVRVQIHANCRLRRIYFADKLYSEEDLPKDYKTFLPSKKK